MEKFKIKSLFFIKMAKGQQGVALLMILTSITILTALLVDFTFETKVNKVKVYNMQDKIQAKLNAEAGVQLAMARLKLYKEAFNLIQKNEQLKNNVPVNVLNQIWSIPFIYPIPAIPDMNIIQKTALEEFSENTLMRGSLKVVIQNISNTVNINMLRVSSLDKNEEEEQPYQQQSLYGEEDEGIFIDKKLIRMLRDAHENKLETDEDYAIKYADIDIVRMVAALKHYVSDKDSYEDEFTSDLEGSYLNRNITPKYAPLSSVSEIMMIEGWNQELLDLIANSITVHGLVMIDLNKITDKTLKMMFPQLLEEQVEEFFKYRDDPEEPHFFNNVKDFKNYFVSIANIILEQDFDKRMEEFEKAGVKFGTTGTLFKVISTGEYERGHYTLSATVALPAKPRPPEKKKDKKNENEAEEESLEEKQENEEDEDDFFKEEPYPGDEKKKEKKKKEQPLQLLDPRTVEIKVS
ncbi:MAG: general secretion pathway protein GspK [Bacteriovoracia bacterium]